MIKKTVCAITAAVAVAFATGAHAADDFPNKPIRLVVGFVPGGGTDVSARILAQHLSGVLGQQVVVEKQARCIGPHRGRHDRQGRT